MSQKSILDNDKFQQLLSIAKSHAKKAPARHLYVKQEEVLSLEVIKEVLAKEGPRGLPHDVLSRVYPEVCDHLSDKELFDLAEITTSNYANNTPPINAAFVPSPLIQSGLPIEKPKGKESTQYHSINGAVEVTLSVPIEKNSKAPPVIPWGIPGRMTLAWISTEIITTGKTRLYIDGVKKNFVSNAIMVKPVKGARGSIARYTESLICWAKTTIQITRNEKYEALAGDSEFTLDMEKYEAIPVADEALLWNSTGFDRRNGGYIQFSDQFVDFVRERAVPVDHETLLLVSSLDSSIAYDLFYWAIYRVDRLEESGQPFARLSWDQFRQQLMPSYAFNSRAIREAMRAMELLNENGISLPISMDKKRGVLIRRPSKPIKGAIPSRGVRAPDQALLDLNN